MSTGKRRGRPPGSSLPSEKRRDQRIDIRVSAPEHERLRNRAAEAKETVSRYVRRKALD